jgi:hypothetical protein
MFYFLISGVGPLQLRRPSRNGDADSPHVLLRRGEYPSLGDSVSG